MGKNETAIKKNLFDVIEGYYIISILKLLQEKNCIDYSSGEINMKYFENKDSNLLFRLVHNRTDILVKKSYNHYIVAKKYRHYLKLGFHIDKFIAAYCRFDLTRSNKWLKPDPYSYSRAFRKAGFYWDYGLPLNLLTKLNAQTVLDLGCGCAALLIKFCENPSCKGIGIELNPFIYKTANKDIREKNLNKKIQLINADAFYFDKHLSSEQMRSIDVITACNYLNEYCDKKGAQLIEILIKLRKRFPNKKLLILDYYNVLERPANQQNDFQYNYLHDTIQLLSGQGLPPANYELWNKYYKKAGCVLENVYDGSSKDIRWFIHIVNLAG